MWWVAFPFEIYDWDTMVLFNNLDKVKDLLVPRGFVPPLNNDPIRLFDTYIGHNTKNVVFNGLAICNITGSFFVSYTPTKYYYVINYDELVAHIDNIPIYTYDQFEAEFNKIHAPFGCHGFRMTKNWLLDKSKGEFRWINAATGVAITSTIITNSMHSGYICGDWSYRVLLRNSAGKYVDIGKRFTLSELIEQLDCLKGDKVDKDRLKCGEFSSEFDDNTRVERTSWGGKVVVANHKIARIDKCTVMSTDGTTFFDTTDGHTAINGTVFYLVFDTNSYIGATNTIAFDFELTKYIRLVQKPGGRREWYQDKTTELKLTTFDLDMIKLYVKEVGAI